MPPVLPSAFHALIITEASAALPRVSTALLFQAPENKDLLELWTLPPADPQRFSGKKIAVLSTDGVEEIELTTILHYFKSRGATVHLVAPRSRRTHPISASRFLSNEPRIS